MDVSDDRVIWDFAKRNGFVLVTQDSDYAELAALYGAPPKVIWLRCGNQPTDQIESLLRRNLSQIKAFEADAMVACLELY